MATFREKFVAFVDILGFDVMVRRSERGEGPSLDEILATVQLLGTKQSRDDVHAHGHKTCPASLAHEKGLDFELTQISDCVIVSAELSPVGVLMVVQHCYLVSDRLLRKGLLCRGYVNRGLIHHNAEQVVGSGYMDAYLKEKRVSIFGQSPGDSGTPFIEVDSAVVDYVNNCGDECVIEMFSRMVRIEGKLTAIFPFQRLEYQFPAALAYLGAYDPEKGKAQVRSLRTGMESIRDKIADSVKDAELSVVQKAGHYIRMLNAQIERTYLDERTIDSRTRQVQRSSPFVKRT